MSLISSACQCVVLTAPDHRCGKPATCAAQVGNAWTAFCDPCKEETMRLLPDYDGTVFYTLEHLASQGHEISCAQERQTPRVPLARGPRVMLDLETLGTRPGAVIQAIGAVEFANGATGREFYVRIDIADACRHGLDIDADTVIWWMRQSDAARAEFCRDGGETLLGALGQFEDWLVQIGGGSFRGEVWGNGATFDNALLAEAYRRNGWHGPPWGKFADRCYRTVKELRPDVKMDRRGTHHNALDDARSQARHLMAIEEALQLSTLVIQ